MDKTDTGKPETFDSYKQKLSEAFTTKPAHAKTPAAYLLKGDVSGIQEFIFNVTSKGAAKSLKARSYYVQVVGELCYEYVWKILIERKIEIKKFYVGGGNFFIEIDYSTGVVDLIDDIQEKIDDYLRYDEVSIVLTISEIYKEEMFHDYWARLRTESNRKKLLKSSSLRSALFVPFDENEIKSVSERVDCLADTDNEPNNIWKAVADRMVKNSIFTVLEFDTKKQTDKDEFTGRIINKLPSWDMYENLNAYKSYREKTYSDDEQKLRGIIDFDALGDFAANRSGTRKLGVLKLDVDNLGELFQRIDSKEQGQALCNDFQNFFDNKLYEFWEKETFPTWNGSKRVRVKYQPNIYTVFAGGDDCFIIGSWDAILYFAELINTKFQEFVKKNENTNSTTISAGIVIVDPSHAVSDIAEKAEEMLSNSKSKMKFGEQKCNKNAVTVFGETLSWDDFSEVLNLKRYLSNLIKSEGQSRSILEVIKNSSKGFENLQNRAIDGKRINMSAVWRLKYYIVRQFSEDMQEKVERDFFTRYIKSLTSAISSNTKTNPMLFAIAARLAEFETRKLLEYGQQDK